MMHASGLSRAREARNRRGCLPDVKDQVALQRLKRIEISSVGIARTLGH